MADRFQRNFQIPVQHTDYFKSIEGFLNQKDQAGNDDPNAHYLFIFKLFDVFNEGKITEAGLFKFMEDASLRRHDQPVVPDTILNQKESENDIFLDIFTNTYAKIGQCFQRKIKK